MTNVLMIEDDADFATLLGEYLAQFNINLTNHEDPQNALNATLSNFDCLILDLTLPKMDGLEVCKQIRAKSEIPIIISSARGDLSDKVLGLQIGADDYLPKPYDPKEMYARLMSLIRRAKKFGKAETPVTPSDSLFTLDDKRYEIRYKNELLRLTPAEYEILKYLITHHGFAVPREQITKQCKSMKGKSTKSLDVLVGRLRGKIDDNPKAPKHIIAVRGVGYKLLG